MVVGGGAANALSCIVRLYISNKSVSQLGVSSSVRSAGHKDALHEVPYQCGKFSVEKN
jgi:hypothetical protein